MIDYVYTPNTGLVPTQGGAASTDARGNQSAPVAQLEANSAAILAALQTLNPSRTQITASATAGAGLSATATLAGTTGKTTYITGFTVIAGVVGAAVSGTVTLTGTVTGTMSYTLVETVSAGGVINVQFSAGIAASGTNTAIVVNVPAIGSGGTISVAATGYQQ